MAAADPPDHLQVALDVTADGRLPLSAQLSADSPSRIHNITMFLYSYDTNRNLTIRNDTTVLDQEPGSTVKHVNWVWPDCLVGSTQVYNVCCRLLSVGPSSTNPQISIHQNFRLNNVDQYTVFDLPISVTNSMASSTARPACDVLDNTLLSPAQIDASADAPAVLFAPGSATQVDVDVDVASSILSNGLGPEMPAAQQSDGLGSGAGGLQPSWWLLAGTAALWGLEGR